MTVNYKAAKKRVRQVAQQPEPAPKIIPHTSGIKYPEFSPAFLSLRDKHEQLTFDRSITSNQIDLSALHGELFIVSFFAGSGLLDLGFEKAGFNPIFVNEWNQEFLAAYNYSRKQMGIPLPAFGFSSDSVDTFLTTNRKLLEETLATARRKGLVGFIGGPPCPDFSVGGKNRGRHGDNGKLTKTYFELILQNKPDWFLFENVKGLWRTKRHREFYDEMISNTLKAGYAVSNELINAIEYGAPQDRDRIIAVGFSKGICTKLGLESGKMIHDGVFPWQKEKTFQRDLVFNLPWPQQHPFGSNSTKPASIPLELTVGHWFKTNDVSKHPNAIHHFKPRAGLVRFQSVAEGDDSRKSYKRLHRWRYSPTACYGNNEVHLHPWLARRITAAEALAIQSLPKEFHLPPKMTLSAMFKTIGNGVPFLAAFGLAKTIRMFLEDKI